MQRKNISQEKIIQSFLSSAFEKSAGATSLTDISNSLEIKKASLYNHFTSRTDMYEETLLLCKKEIGSISFLSDKTIESIKSGRTALLPLFKRLITRFINLYEGEPLFQMFVFVRTEQYFNQTALKIIQKEKEKISDDIRKILQAFCDIHKILETNQKELKEKANIISSLIIEQRDLYISNRKEIIRQNPESGAGSLFALPSDDSAILKTYKLVEIILNSFF